MSITPDAITQTLVAAETIAAGECVTASGHIARAPEDVFAVATAEAIAGKSLTCTTSGAALLAWDTTQIIDRGDWLTCTAEGTARRAEAGDMAIARALEPARGTRLHALLTLAPQGVGSGGGSGGVTPNITATASVDDSGGTPAVTVTKTGTQAAPVLSFAFTGLRGGDGAPGRDGADGAPGKDGKDGKDGADGASVILSPDVTKTPVGAIIAVMGTAAPANYLVCDGSIHNIADYPDLAAHFAATFGAANRFGGDGATTFAVPNLQGEFLRGAGTNGHPNQGNGAAVGEHQDATFISDGFCNNSIAGFSYPAEGYPMDASYKSGIPRINDDSHLQTAPRAGFIGSYGKQVSSSGYTVEWHSTRPTNTSVLWCICARNTYRAGCAYSTDEQPVGTWMDGKTVYQKVVATPMQATMQTFAQRAWTQLNIAGMPAVETLVDGRIHVDATGAGKPTAYISVSFYVNANGIYYYADTAYGWRQVFVVLRYTKP